MTHNVMHYAIALQNARIVMHIFLNSPLTELAASGKMAAWSHRTDLSI